MVEAFQDLETRMVPVDKLIPYANNAKIHTEAQIEHIRASIRAFGFNDPVGVWTNDDGQIEIVTGHGSVLAAKKEGMTEVPCNFLDHLTDEERREYCHVHNQTQLETGFDYSVLVDDMDNLNCCWNDFGFEGYLFNAGFDAIEDLAENEFAKNVTNSSGETFNITFTFPGEQRELIEAYVKDVSKKSIVDEIVSRAVGKWGE